MFKPASRQRSKGGCEDGRRMPLITSIYLYGDEILVLNTYSILEWLDRYGVTHGYGPCMRPCSLAGPEFLSCLHTLASVHQGLAWFVLWSQSREVGHVRIKALRSAQSTLPSTLSESLVSASIRTCVLVHSEIYL